MKVMNMLEKLFRENGNINQQKISKLNNDELQYIIKESSSLDLYSSPSIRDRVIFITQGKNLKFCVCGKICNFSKSKGPLFVKTCGNHRCVRALDSKETKNKSISSRIKKLESYDIVSKEEIKQYFISEYKGMPPNEKKLNLSNKYCVSLKKYAKETNYSLGVYLHILLENKDIENYKCSCGSGFYQNFFGNIKEGYRPKGVCKKCFGSRAAYSKKTNSLDQKIKAIEIDNRFKIKKTSFLNEGTFILECNICKYENETMFNNGKTIENFKCEKCFPSNKSKQEYILIEFLKSIGIDEIIHGYRDYEVDKLRSFKEIDCYIPNKKIGIELNGLYWHTNIDKNYHIEKKEFFKNKEIDILHFTDIELIEKKEICYSIIKNRLGIIENKIFARKCKIREINNNLYKIFVNKNHISGYVNAKIKVGLFFEEKLVSVASFSKPRFKNEDKLEMIRFCSELDTSIVGGLSKIISFVFKKYNKNIVSFCDYSKYNGLGYTKAGFKFVKKTPPNYWYYKSGFLFNRMKFQKHKIKKMPFYSDAKTEKQIMEENGFSRYYDCGNLLMEYSG